MMRFARPPRPWGWQTHALKAGRSWLARPGNRNRQRPHDYWSRYRAALAAGFNELCGYTVMWEPNGTVDHYIPWATVRNTRQAHQAYQWTNLRYSVNWFNRDRGTTDVPDPFTVQDDWFELLLPSLELVATAAVPAGETARVAAALRWLGQGQKVVNARRGYFTAYRSGGMTIEQLDRWAPLLSRALRANVTFLLPADQARLAAGTL